MDIVKARSAGLRYLLAASVVGALIPTASGIASPTMPPAGPMIVAVTPSLSCPGGVASGGQRMMCGQRALDDRYRVPPRMRAAARPSSDEAPLARFVVQIDVFGGKETLWSGPVTLEGQRSASFSKEQSGPGPEDCTGSGFSRSGGAESLRVDLNAMGMRDGRDWIALNVRWGRTPEGTCPNGGSSRVVQLSEIIGLGEKSIVIRGDGGLVVSISRR